MPRPDPQQNLSLVWFKRDLRVTDHLPLAKAAARGPVACVYIYEPIVYRAAEHDTSHFLFVNECLQELRAELRAMGSELILAHGHALDVLEQLRRELGYNHLYSHEETGLTATFQRDKAVAAWSQSVGVFWYEYPQHGVNRPAQDRDGWAGRWRRFMDQPICTTPKTLAGPKLSSHQLGGLLNADDLGLAPSTKLHVQHGGMHHATQTLDTFLTQRGEHYQQEMSSPVTSWDACSRISPYLAYGALSLRQAYQQTRQRQSQIPAKARTPWRRSLASFHKRLCWHCHFIQKLEDEPSLEFHNLCAAYDGMREENPANWGPSESERFDAWATGQTGYPLVDACMRCLHTTGWINFRMRAMLVSFACYHLWLHWKPVAEHLAKQFLDFEPGIHYPQCQMQAGVTGINTVRIYSPIKQAKDQDPEGLFTRRWIPALANVPTQYLAQPEQMPPMTQHMAGCIIGRDYPAPITNHVTAYRTARDRVYRIKSQASTRELAQQVYRKHGSRRRPTQRQSHGPLFNSSTKRSTK